ncbi:MAG: FkbM family methyltransferase [Deltaproteobacteria bacterium]|nr:FkbM family methyltransferase [Deltaproteobacteria bacterium]
MTDFAWLSALDDPSLIRAIEDLYVAGAPEPDLEALCRSLAGRGLALSVPGGTVRVDLGDWTSIVMIRLRAWEPHLSGLAMALVRPGDFVVDVGAHVGTWTLLLGSLVGERGQVVAFEPYGPSAARARDAVLAAGHGDRARVVEAAVGERAGRAPLYAGTDSMLHSLVLGTGHVTDVPVTTLDELGPRAVRFLKIDTEGLELAVLRGGRALLAGCDPSLLIELHAEQLVAQGSSSAEVFAELRAQGFVVFDLRPEGFDLHVEPLLDERAPTTHHVLARRDPSPFVVSLR